MKNIGLKNLDFYHLKKTNLKKDLLYFDEVLIDEQNLSDCIGWSEIFKDTPQKEVMDYSIQEIEYLEKQGLVRIEKLEDSFNKTSPYSNLEVFHNENVNEFRSKIMKGDSKEKVDALLKFFRRMNLELNLNSRIFCAKLNEIGILNIKPIIEIRNKEVALPDLKFQQHIQFQKNVDVINLVLTKFPIPDDSISWEALIDFKKNNDLQIYRLGLINWITEIANSNYNILEIEQKLEYLLKQYEERLKLEKIKYHTGSTEIVVTTSLAVIENLIKLNFSKAAETVFKLRNKKIDLLLGETLAPGREVAYINKTIEKFA